MTVQTERKYQMTRVRSGSYLLPSNDGQTLWHIYRFMDGRSFGLDEPDRMWWACAKFNGTFDEAGVSVLRDLRDLDRIDEKGWTETATYLPTRRAAIAHALGDS